MFTTITVTGTFQRSDGQPAEGHVTATLSASIQNAGTIIEPAATTGIVVAGALMDSSGIQPLTLAANDDPGTLPAGSSYLFVIELDTAPVLSFSAVIPASAAGGTVDLATLEP